jgi:uncharacterized protein with HEPN domain
MDRTKRNISILEHIIKYCEEMPEIHKYFGDTYEIFKTNSHYFKSVAMNILQIGELINHLSKEFQEKYPQIPYRSIVSLRNVIVHGYGTLESDKIWDTSRTDTSELQKRCSEIIAEIKN